MILPKRILIQLFAVASLLMLSTGAAAQGNAPAHSGGGNVPDHAGAGNAPDHAGAGNGQSASGPGNSANAPGRNRNIGHNNASDGVRAIIQANRHIFYQGDPLEINVRFPRGSQLITSGEADAYLVIFEPDALMVAVALNDVAGPGNHNLFYVDSVDVEEIPEGVYQMGVVLTVPEGNPFNLEEWYNGLLGLLTVQGLTVSSTPLDIDENGDGFVDGDENGNGFVDEEEEEEEE